MIYITNKQTRMIRFGTDTLGISTIGPSMEIVSVGNVPSAMKRSYLRPGVWSGKRMMRAKFTTRFP